MDKYKFNHRSCIALVLSVVAGAWTLPVQANFLSDSHLSVRLRNEYRNAERPSASDGVLGPKIDAWVQGALVDYSSGQWADTISIQAGSHRIQKLSANPHKSTRFYLDGHDSFDLNYASLNLHLAPWARFKIGRFITDYSYGSLEYQVPLINVRSQRTIPSMNEGVLYRGDFGNFHLYGMYSRKYAGGYFQKWTDEGYNKRSWLNSKGDKYESTVEKRPSYVIAGVWDNHINQLSLGAGYQRDLSWQLKGRASHKWSTANQWHNKTEFLGFYAKSIGRSVGLNPRDHTYVLTGQVAWHKNRVTYLTSVGFVESIMSANRDIDTDITFPFDLSISRNNYDTYSAEVATFYNLTRQFTIGAAVVGTHGYEDANHDVSIRGFAGNLILAHQIREGKLKGLKTVLMFNKGEEHRPGSRLGTTVKYYDIKLTMHYKLNLL